MGAKRSRISGFLGRNWLFITGVTLAAFLLTEVLLRLLFAPTSPLVPLVFVHGDKNCVRPRPDSAQTWYAAGIAGRPTTHSINSLGIRSDLPDQRSGFSIAVLGGSDVYGVGIESDQTIAGIMQRLADQEFEPARVKVVNLGFCGFNLEEQLRELERLAPVFKPDMVVTVLDATSFDPVLCARRAMPVRNFLVDHVALAALIEDKILPRALLPGWAINRQVDSHELNRTARLIRKVVGQPPVFVKIDVPDLIPGRDGGLVSFDTPLQNEGAVVIDPTRSSRCPETKFSQTRSGDFLTADSAASLAEIIWCEITPMVSSAVGPLLQRGGAAGIPK